MRLPWLDKLRREIARRARRASRGPSGRLCRRCERAEPLPIWEKELWYSCIVCGDSYCPDCFSKLDHPPMAIPERLCEGCSGFVRPDDDSWVRL